MARSQKKIYVENLNPSFGFCYSVDKILHAGKTPFQTMELAQTTEFGNVLLLDGILQVVEKNDYQYHEPMVHPALCCHPKPRDVLVIGGGDGGILREALKYPTVQRVDFAELDKGVVDFSRKYLRVVHGGAFDDPRVAPHYTDGRKFVEDNPGSFDAVIMDLTDPFGPAAMLYTKEFFASVKKSFTDKNGVFVMQSQSPVSRPEAFNCIQTTLRTTFKNVRFMLVYIQMYAVLWSITIASDAVDVAKIVPAVINNRLRKYKVSDLKLYTGETHRAMLTSYPYVDEILRIKAPVITDSRHDFPDNFLNSSFTPFSRLKGCTVKNV